MSLLRSYTFLAPLYDPLIASASRGARRRSLAALHGLEGAQVLLPGIGTGLDIPDLPPGNTYVGLDLTPAMIERARPRAARRGLRLVRGDAMQLPFAADRFDRVILHLILAVAPKPAHVLAEAARVLKPAGRILILDKFLRPGQAAPLRRCLNVLSARIATRLDVVFEVLLAAHPELQLVENEPALANGWFRRIVLEKRVHSAAAGSDA